jgi:hypothetical protein
MTNYVDTDGGREVQLFEAFAYNGNYEVKVTGFSAIAANGVTTDMDFAIGAEDRYINGLRIILDQHHIDDTIDMMVVDVDGIIPEPYRAAYPSYPVLKQFGFACNVDHTVGDQGRDVFNFVAKINAGLYLRFSYTSNGTSDVLFKVNAYLNKKTTV